MILLIWYDSINWWSYWNNTTWKIKKKEGRFLGALLAPLAASLVSLVSFSCFINFFSSKGYKWRGVRRAGRGEMDENF